MDEKRILIVPADLVEKLDANRGDASRADLLTFLLEHALHEGKGKEVTSQYVTHQELETFERDIRSLLRRFLDFFLVYGLELSAAPPKEDLDVLQQKLKKSASAVQEASKTAPR